MACMGMVKVSLPLNPKPGVHLMSVDTIYCERANGKWEYWYYSDGRRFYVNEAKVNKWVRMGEAQIVNVN